MYSLALPPTVSPSTIQKDWYGIRPGAISSVDAWIRSIQSEKPDSNTDRRPIGYRKSKRQTSDSVAEDLPLPDISQQEQDPNLPVEEPDEVDLSTSFDLQSPIQPQRVVALLDGDDGLGLDDDEPAYYDSGEE